MIKNFWGDTKTSFFCPCHQEPVLMVPSGDDASDYVCPKFYAKDEVHPDGHESWEVPCPNKVSAANTISLVEKFMGMVEDNIQNFVMMDYKGVKFAVGSVSARVLVYGERRLNKEPDSRQESDSLLIKDDPASKKREPSRHLHIAVVNKRYVQ